MHIQYILLNVIITVLTGSPVAMAKDPLAEASFYFELNRLRVLEPEVSQKTLELREECKEFVDSKQDIYLHHLHFFKIIQGPINDAFICLQKTTIF